MFNVCLLLVFQALLVDVRDKLLFEQEYAGSIKSKLPPRSSLHIPWSWLPAALCVLQEVMCNRNTLQSKICKFNLVLAFHIYIALAEIIVIIAMICSPKFTETVNI